MLMRLQRAAETYFLLREVRIPEIFKKKRNLIYFIFRNEMYHIYFFIIQIETKLLTNKNFKNFIGIKSLICFLNEIF